MVLARKRCGVEDADGLEEELRHLVMAAAVGVQLVVHPLVNLQDVGLGTLRPLGPVIYKYGAFGGCDHPDDIDVFADALPSGSLL